MSPIRIINILKDLVLTILRYLLVVVGGTYLFLIILPVIGYLPYSDRPGIGWHWDPFSISWSEFFGNAYDMSGFIIFLSIYATIAAILLFIPIRIIERFLTDKAAVRAIGGIISGLLSGYIVWGIGWYIGLDILTPFVSLLFGAIFGSVLLPTNSTKPTQ